MKRRVSQYTQLRNAKAEIADLKKIANEIEEIHSFFDNVPLTSMHDKTIRIGNRDQSVMARLATFLAQR